MTINVGNMLRAAGGAAAAGGRRGHRGCRVEARLVLDDIQHESELAIMDTARSLANIFSPPLRTLLAIKTLLGLVPIAIFFVPAIGFGAARCCRSVLRRTLEAKLCV